MEFCQNIMHMQMRCASARRCLAIILYPFYTMINYSLTDDFYFPLENKSVSLFTHMYVDGIEVI